MKDKIKIDQIYNKDCLDILKRMESNSVNLIITSPPYANNRAKTYGGVPIGKYVEWFLPISKELNRVLKPEGSFILNIKERAQNGERGTYVIELILEMRKQGWLWTEEYLWNKKNSFPGKWPNRFRDAWERCLHFTKQKKFKMYQKAVMVPRGEWAETRLKHLSKTDRIRDESKVSSGFGKNVSNWVNRKMVYPTNVLNFATVCSNVKHSASFPTTLPSWFIKLFTKENDVVLDPFLGVGTTALAAKNLRRHYIGAEISNKYYKIAVNNLNQNTPNPRRKNKQTLKILQ